MQHPHTPNSLRIAVGCDGCDGRGEIRARLYSNPDHAACDLETCPDCRGEGERVITVDPRDPWAVLRALRARVLVRATEESPDDEEDPSIDGCDAVDELGAIRSFLDAARAANGR